MTQALHYANMALGWGGPQQAPALQTNLLDTATKKSGFAYYSEIARTLNEVWFCVSAVGGTLGANDIRVDVFNQVSFIPGTSQANSVVVATTPTGAALVKVTGLTYAMAAETPFWIVISNAAASPGTNNFTVVDGQGDTWDYGDIGQDGPTFSLRERTTDGTTWATSVNRTQNILLKFSDGSIHGICPSAYAVESSANCVYSGRKLGSRLTWPNAAPRIAIGRMSMLVRKAGTPTGKRQYEILEVGNNTPLGTSKGVDPVLMFGTSNGYWIPLVFPTPIIWNPGHDYRIVCSETTQSDASSDRLELFPFTFPNDATVLAQIPFQCQKTYWDGSVWTDTPTQGIPFKLQLADTPARQAYGFGAAA